MLLVIGEFVVWAVVVATAGAFLASRADHIAEATGLGRLLIGSILLAGATSLPELAVDISAVRSGHVDLAVGDLLGSSLMNLLILAVMDLTHYSRGKMLSREAAGHALSGTMSIAITALAGFAIITGSRTEPWTVVGINVGSVLLVITYTLGVRMVFLQQRIERTAVERIDKERSAETHGLARPAIEFTVAAVVIILTGPRLADTAHRLAELTGLGTSFVGTTLVALTTSLPEMASTFAAVRMGAMDLAIGNIFGSNVFNMVLLVPLDLVHDGSLYAAADDSHVITSLAVCVATCIVIMGQLYHVEKRTRFFEPDGALVILVVSAALVCVYAWN